jgi:L-malate glycosyltransferase
VLKILALNYEFPPIGGGGGNAHSHILSELAAYTDLQITLVTSTHCATPYSETVANRVQVHFLPIPKENMQYWKRGEIFHYLITQYGFLQHYLKSTQFDLCHAFFGFPTGLLAWYFRKKMPYIVSVRGSDVPGYNPRFSWDYLLLKPLLKRIYTKSEAVVANSQGLRLLFEKQFSQLSASVIPNGVDTTIFYPQKKQIRPHFSIVTVARLIPRKGIDVLIDACTQINENGFHFELHIIGEGPEEENLRKKADACNLSSRIHFYGRMEKHQIAAFLPLCDAFVLPSYAEGMSNAALEAMACGLPLILTDTGGSLEMINGNGFIVPTGDANAIARQIINLISNPGQTREMSKQSRFLAEQLSWKQVARHYYELYYQVAAQSLR